MREVGGGGEKGKESRKEELLSSFFQIGLVSTISSGPSFTLTPPGSQPSAVTGIYIGRTQDILSEIRNSHLRKVAFWVVLMEPNFPHHRTPLEGTEERNTGSGMSLSLPSLGLVPQARRASGRIECGKACNKSALSLLARGCYGDRNTL